MSPMWSGVQIMTLLALHSASSMRPPIITLRVPFCCLRSPAMVWSAWSAIPCRTYFASHLDSGATGYVLCCSMQRCLPAQRIAELVHVCMALLTAVFGCQPAQPPDMLQERTLADTWLLKHFKAIATVFLPSKGFAESTELCHCGFPVDMQ